MKKYTFLSILVVSQSLAFEAKAQVLDEMKRFQKCYGIMVGQRVALNNPLWMQVKAGSITGTNACMQVFNLAKLDQNGEVSKSGGVPNEVGMKILANFLRFHKSQFQTADYTLNIGGGNDRQTRDVIDANEPLYHIIYSIFGRNQQWSDTLTRDYSLAAKRYSQYPTRARSILDQNLLPFTQGRYMTIKDAEGKDIQVPHADGVESLEVEYVQTGLLFGLKQDDRQNLATHFRVTLNNGVSTADLNEHHGAGAIGTQAYLLANLGRGDFNDGGSKMYRRWGKHVVEDFLCRTQPTLRSYDVAYEVDTQSTIAFRKGSSCMACHATMDPIAGAARNLRFSFTHNTGLESTRVKYVGNRFPDMAAVNFPKDKPDANFYRRPADARLFYRSYNGDLVDENVTGLQSLGETITQTNDFYVCAAKRYYQFLTGIEVTLADEGDVNTPVFKEGELNQRNKVIQLGMKLKEHQSIEKLIEEIISSKAFISPDKGV